MSEIEMMHETITNVEVFSDGIITSHPTHLPTTKIKFIGQPNCQVGVFTYGEWSYERIANLHVEELKDYQSILYFTTMFINYKLTNGIDELTKSKYKAALSFISHYNKIIEQYKNDK